MPQAVRPEAQLVTQALPAQICPAGQTVVQLPQWLRSVAVSKQAEPQTLWPDGHERVHEPAVHTWPDGQTVPQAPQFDRSEPTSLHTPEQLVRPEPQVTEHTPDTQA